ncbi:MAG TPA: FAD-binding oxidoreductase [bacterium]|jgi:FAD/FMN-containing dehydrogenase
MTQLSNLTISVEELQNGFAGEVVLPSHPSYDEYRSIWNAMIDKKPAIIARCTNTADVVKAVNFGRENGLLVSVRGGGHHIGGNAVNDEGLVIDLTLMKTIKVDAKAKTANVGPGCKLGEVDAETQKYGLAVPAGIISDTGVAGLTLGGGYGWISRKYGLTIDNMKSAEVVTANGDIVTASEAENPDLFWGLRGGSGNFGIVTNFEFNLCEVGPEIYAGLVVYPIENGKEYLKWQVEYLKPAPDEFTVWNVLRKAPPLPFLPEEVHGKLVVVVAICSLASEEESTKLSGEILNWGTPYGSFLGMMPFTNWQAMFDDLMVPPARNYWKSHNFNEIPGELIDVCLEAVQKLPSPNCEVFLINSGGQVNRVPADATAFGHRDAKYVMNMHTRWDDPADDEKCRTWARDLFEACKPYSTGGVYVNFEADHNSERAHASYSNDAIWNRLVELKNKWDPTNLFRMNQNIPPSA